MSPFEQMIVVILAACACCAAACLMVAWLDIVVHPRDKPLMNPAEMRRYMCCGFYCNPQDPRPVVHRPLGWGYTINLRREQLAVVVIVMSAVILVTAVIIALVPME
jgi:uncharacterized membrane protein